MTRLPSVPSFVRVARPGPDDALAKMLAAFVEADRSLTRREAEVRAFGHTSFTATWAASAVRELRSGGYIRSSARDDRRYIATDKGRAMLGVLRACEPQGPGAA